MNHQKKKVTVRSSSRISFPTVLCAFAVLAITAVIVAAWQSAGAQPGNPQRVTSLGNEQSKPPNQSGSEQQHTGDRALPGPAATKETSSSRKNKESAISMLDGVLLGTDRITPVEYSVLAQVEAATLLWQIDQGRSWTLLKSACETMRDLKEKDPDKSINSRQRRLRFLAYLKIARLKPDLVKDLALNSNNEKSTQAISGDWGEEARAVIAIASEQIEKNPTLAAQLARQTFSLGQIDWATFLRRLSARDQALSEQLAMTVIDRLSASSLTPIYLLNFYRFALAPERSAQLKDRFFEGLAIRLRRNLNPATPSDELRTNLATTQEALRMAASYPRWQGEFEGLTLGFQELLQARSVAVADPRNSKNIPIPMMDEITPGETQEIAEAVPRVERISEARSRDSKYQEMANRAASKSDLRLAEQIISKIEDEAVRGDTSISVYGSFVRKALSESDWTGARDYASRIVDPLGRTLILDRIARGVSQSSKDKQLFKDIYSLAAYRLRRDLPTEDVAKAFIILAKSLLSADPDASADAVSWAIHILNKLTRNGELLGECKVGSALAWWVNSPSFRLQDEALDLSEMIGPLFREMAKRDPYSAQSMAYDLLIRVCIRLPNWESSGRCLRKTEETKASRDQRQMSGEPVRQKN